MIIYILAMIFYKCVTVASQISRRRKKKNYDYLYFSYDNLQVLQYFYFFYQIITNHYELKIDWGQTQ